ncbi:MAG: hypothetical protein ACJ8J0_23180, partial [Longimicrobiaceae bacterium]
NGDSAAHRIRASGVAGMVVPLREVLHEGPVPGGISAEALNRVRAEYISSMGWATREQVEAEFADQEGWLAAAGSHPEVVLWFEHDLYDQLQLAQLLDFFSTAERGETRLTLVCGPEYLGPSTPERLAERFAERAEVTAEQLALGHAAWSAFRSPDPRVVASRVLLDMPELPFLRTALIRHLEQFPSTRNGLSRSEQQALEEIDGGAATVRDAYLASHHRREDPIWLGDATFADYMEALAAGPSPLVSLGDGGDPMERTLALTDAGREVLAGREDRVRLNGIDRWLGGVHLQGHETHWRWDVAARRLAEV